MAVGETGMQITCDETGATTTYYKDKECKEEDKKETQAWGCNKEDKVFITGASLVQATMASLVLGAASYMAWAKTLINEFAASNIILNFKLNIHLTICG